jgi:nicotinamidase-related amidase
LGKKSVLLVIDVQVGLFSIENFPIYKEEALVQNILNLIKKARDSDVKIIFVQHNSSKGELLETDTKNWKIHPKLEPKKEDIIIQKFQSDSFFKTKLDKELKKDNKSHLVITGLMTPMCIDTTVRSAFSHGYEVTLIQDAHSAIDSEILTAPDIIAHHNNVLQWFANIKKENEFQFT